MESDDARDASPLPHRHRRWIDPETSERYAIRATYTTQRRHRFSETPTVQLASRFLAMTRRYLNSHDEVKKRQ
jgi:hypothetical protein